MNPAELSLSTISPAITNHVGGSKTIAQQAALAAGSSSSKIERVNLEPIYVQLKAALGDNWGEYKLALSQFVKGCLNQSELAWVLQPILSPVPSNIPSTDSNKAPPSTLHLHNTLLAALYANSIRDPPPTDVAPWVVATDKPTSTSKSAGAGSVTNDKFEERQKNEVMGMAPRDRKRIKGLKEVAKPVNDPFHEMHIYANELVVKPSSQIQQQAEPQSANGTGPSAATATLARSSHDLEIRRRYAQTLASEALEFPSVVDMQNRIEPICYEEGLAGGVQQGALQSVAELVEQAAEVFVKEMLGGLLGHARSNGVGESIQTNKFRRQLRKEEDDAERGVVQRNAAGLLPVEMEMQAKRDPLDMQDLRLSLKLADTYLELDHYLGETIMLNHYPEMDTKPQLNGHIYGDGRPLTNGVKRSSTAPPDADAMDIDGFDYGSFKGVEKRDQENVNPERAVSEHVFQGDFHDYDLRVWGIVQQERRKAERPTGGDVLGTLLGPGRHAVPSNAVGLNLRGFGFRLDGLTSFNGPEMPNASKPTKSMPVIDEEDILAETATHGPSASRRGSTQTRKKSCKSKPASVAPPDEDSITVVPRAKNKRKRTVVSNFESDDEVLPPPKKAALKRKKRVETSEDEDEIAQLPKAKAPRRKKQDKAVAGADEVPSLSKMKKATPRRKKSRRDATEDADEAPSPSSAKKPTPKSKKSSKDATEADKDAPELRRAESDKTKERGKGATRAPAVPFSNPYQLQRPVMRGPTEVAAPKRTEVVLTPAASLSNPQAGQRPAQTSSGMKGANEPVLQPVRHPYTLSVPAPSRNQHTRISQSPSTGAPTSQGKPSLMEARASVSRDFASAYHDLPTTVTNVNGQDFGRTALFQVRHREQEHSGAEPVAISLPLDFVPGANERRVESVVAVDRQQAQGPRVVGLGLSVPATTVPAVSPGHRQQAQGDKNAGVSMPAVSVPANGHKVGSVVPGGGHPNPSRTLEDQEDWRKLFEDWSKSAEGTAALSHVSANKRPTQAQPPSVGNTGYDGIDQYVSELTRTKDSSSRKELSQKTPKSTAASPASSPALSVNQSSIITRATPAEAPTKDALKEYLDALEETSQKNRNNANLPPTTPAPFNVIPHMEETSRRQRGMSSSSAASAHSSYTQSSHNRQHSGNASSQGTPSKLTARPPLARPSAAPVVPSMGSNNVDTLDGSGDFSMQNQRRCVSRGQETYTLSQRLQWPQWSNAAGNPPRHNMAVYRNPHAATISNPFVSVPHVSHHQGFSMPVQAPGMAHDVSNVSSQGLSPRLFAHQAMGVQMQAPTMVRRVSNASSQDSAPQQRLTSAGGQMGSRTSMPPPASPVQHADHSLEDPMVQVRRDSFYGAQGLIAGANSPPRLQGQYPPQRLPPRGLSTSPSVQLGAMPVTNGLNANGMPMPLTPHMRPFTMPGNGSFVQVRQPSMPPQRSPVQRQGHIMQGTGQIAGTPPQTIHRQPLPSTPTQQQQQRTPQFVLSETLRPRASSIATKSPRSAASNASPRTDDQGHFHFPNCGCSFCRNAVDDGDAAAGGSI